MEWPSVNVREGKLEDFNFTLIQKGVENCKIKEIVMLDVPYEDVTYNKDYVPLTVTCEEPDFDAIDPEPITILFSKVSPLEYNAPRYTSTYKLASTESVSNADLFVSEEVLTRIYNNMLEDFEHLELLKVESKEEMDELSYQIFLQDVYMVSQCLTCRNVWDTPYVNLKLGKLQLFKFKLWKCNEVDCSPKTTIKEIMIINSLDLISYNKTDIPLIVTYELEKYGIVYVLFSKVANLKFDSKTAWKKRNILKIVTSEKNEFGGGIAIETLTKMFQNVLEEI